MALKKPLSQTERKKIKLASDLQEALDKIGDNPLKEPERFAIIEKDDDSEVVEELWATFPAFKNKKVSAEQQSVFIERVISKIADFEDVDGEYKDTENTKECDTPTMKQCTEITKAAKELDLSWSIEKQTEWLEKTKKQMLKISGLNIKDLTEWEQLLVIQQVRSFAFGQTTAAVGKYIKNL
jgi:hypothetical protein